MKPQLMTHSIPLDQDLDQNSNVPSKLKQFKRLPRRMSSFLRQGLLSIAVITSVIGVASQTIAQTFSTGLLSPGDRGSSVSLLQQALSREGFDVSVDGIYGPVTTSAVSQFQRSCGLLVDGIAGPQTNTALASGRCTGGLIPVQPEPPISGLPVGPYVAVIPGDDPTDLQTARQVVAAANREESRRGRFISAGGYRERSQAEEIVNRLRDRRLDARVEYRP